MTTLMIAATLTAFLAGVGTFTRTPVGATGSNASFADLLSRAARDTSSDEGTAYDATIGRQFGQRHAGTVGACVETSGEMPETFQMVLIVAADGTVVRIALDRETSVARCVRDGLMSEVFPQPPFAPFHDRIRLSFQ